jgi:antitoxin (DNA-binding transcriptional repressor) of toxin-antitoxin stability system
MKTIPVTEFKSQCLSVLRDIEEHHESIAIEKRGKTIAQVIPVADSSQSGYGCMRHSVTVNSDITEPLNEEWDALG